MISDDGAEELPGYLTVEIIQAHGGQIKAETLVGVGKVHGDAATLGTMGGWATSHGLDRLELGRA